MDINAYPKGCFASFKRHTNTKRTTFAMKLLSGAVSVAIGAFGVSGQVSAFPGTDQFKKQDGVWTLGTDSGFQVTTGGTDQIPVYSLMQNTTVDPYDNSIAWLWSYSNSTTPSPSSLNVVISKTQDWSKNGDGKFKDTSNTTMWLAGGLVSLFSDGKQATKEDVAAATSIPVTGKGARTANGNELSVTFGKNVTFMGKFFGSRNDLGGGLTATINSDVVPDAATIGEANNNTLNLIQEENSCLYVKIAYGGRSAQLDSINGSSVNVQGVTTKAVHKGFQTNYNKVKIQGVIDGQAKDLVTAKIDEKGTVTTQDKNYGNSSLLITKGVFGAEGYEANNNMVVVNNTVLVAGMPAARKLGLVGGRGDYYQRINQLELPDGNGGTVKNNALIWDGDSLAKQSGYANNNVVIVDNSYIGFRVPIANNNWDLWPSQDFPTSWKDEKNPEHAFSIYGGWSIGEAKDNIVSLKNSVVNGNVIGGYELLNRADASKDDMRNLNANLVSLFNTKLTKGSSVYGTATGSGVAEVDANTKFVRLSESSLQAVNRRRGVVYFAGENEADSVWARYVHFGQYVDNAVLEKNPDVERNITRDYYPTSENYQSTVGN